MGSLARLPLATRNSDYFFTLQFETNNTDAPDGLVPDYSSTYLAIDQTATGVYTITFTAAYRPGALLWGHADFLEDMPGWSVKVVSYVPSTGVLTLKAYDEDDTSGIAALADSNNKTIQLACLFSRNANQGVI